MTDDEETAGGPVEYTIEKCDDGVPLPPGSHRTWYTWDVRVDGRSISQHREREEAKGAVEILRRHPRLRALLRNVQIDGKSDTAILHALEAAFDTGREDGYADGQRDIIDGGGP